MYFMCILFFVLHVSGDSSLSLNLISLFVLFYNYLDLSAFDCIRLRESFFPTVYRVDVRSVHQVIIKCWDRYETSQPSFPHCCFCAAPCHFKDMLEERCLLWSACSRPEYLSVFSRCFASWAGTCIEAEHGGYIVINQTETLLIFLCIVDPVKISLSICM